MEKRLLLALALSFLILLLWSKFFIPKEPTPIPVPEKKVEVLKTEEKREEIKSEEIIKGEEEKNFSLENDYIKINFTNKGAKITQIFLKKYLDYNKNPLSLYPLYNPKFSPLDLNFEDENLNLIVKNELYKAKEGRDEITFYISMPEVSIKRKYKLQDGFLKFDLEVENKIGKNCFLSMGPGLREVDPREENNKFLLPANFIYNDFKGLERKAITKFGKKMPYLDLFSENIKYFGLEDSYFAFLLIPASKIGNIKVYPEKNIFAKTKLKYGFEEEALSDDLKERVNFNEEKNEISIFGFFNEKEKIAFNWEALRPKYLDPPLYLTENNKQKIKNCLKDQKDLKRIEGLLQKNVPQLFISVELLEKKNSFDIFFGAKDYEFLKKTKPELTELVNFGFFSFIAKPLLWILKGINNLIGNWGFSILILTLLLRIVLYPINHKQIVSMKKMQKAQPKIDAIRKKYKNALKDMDERAKMNQEIMEVYKREGINPLGGCLPLAIQIPILWAFYSMLSFAIELRNSPFIFWIKDLSSKDPYYITPILMGVAMLWQQKMTPTSGTGSQKFLMNTVPIFFTFFFLNLPSGVVLYWLLNNILQIIQTYLYKWHFREAQK